MAADDIAVSFLRAVPITSDEKLAQCVTHDRSDTGNALRLVSYFGSELRYVRTLGWMAWNGRYWDIEAGVSHARRRAHQVIELIKAEAEHLFERNRSESKLHAKFAAQSGQSARIQGMLREAEVYCEVDVSELDANPLLITCENGTLRLRSPKEAGTDDVIQFSEHCRDDLATCEIPIRFDPGAACPKWEKFVSQIIPDSEVRTYLQRSLGYCLTGSIKEQVFFFFLGSGGNGKTTLLRVVGKVMGPLRATLPIEALLKGNRRSSGNASPELVRLRNARLVTTSEPPASSKLAEATLKDLTGGDPMFVRPLFKDAFEFVPLFKIIMSMNDKPMISERDQGIWRRVHVVPFEKTIPESERIRDLYDAFDDELPGILNWILDGLRMWGDIGLCPPAAVINQIEGLRSELDWLNEFLSSQIEFIEGEMVSGAALYNRFREWSVRNGRNPESSTRFGREMRTTRIRKEKLRGTMQYLGVQLRPWSERV